MKKTNGFTLVEMMLVIAVIAIITTFGLMTYRKYFETARIDKSALEMQHVLEAALAYNVDEHKWPKENNDVDCEMTPPEPSNSFVKNYIPNQDAQSPYGSYFCWSSAGGDENTKKKDQRLFWVAMRVPGDNEALAKRVAARLPNAIATSDPNQTQASPCDASACYVRAEVVQPGASSQGGGSGMVVATGNCPTMNNAQNSNADSSTCHFLSGRGGSQYRIVFKACPDGEIPRVTVSPNFIYMPSGGWPGYSVKDIVAERTKMPCTTKDGAGKQSCDVGIYVTFCGGKGPDNCKYKDIRQHGGAAGASYVIACIPKQSSPT